jgi:hypothetical protein
MQKSFSGSMVLGMIVVLMGILFLLKNVLNIHIPIFTIMVSLGMIWIGIMLIRGQFQAKNTAERVSFGESFMRYSPGQREYKVMFGSGSLNLQDLRPDSPLQLQVDCNFGEMKVVLSREVPLYISGNASFASLNGPDLRTVSFGNYTYTSPGYNPSLPGITLHANVNFGELRIFYL